MLKRLIAVIALATSIGCADSTTPGGTINVRVVDDRGDPVYRTQVMVTYDDASPVTVLTGRDGKATIRVSASGDYIVRVIPRNGYLGLTEVISKTISVSVNESSSVDFTIFREGLPN